MRGLLLLFAASLGLAQVDPDTQAAKRHFEAGRELYDGGKYDAALAEFSTARKLKPLPEMLYNIARTYERMENWSRAADTYEQYLSEKPDAADAAELRSRIPVLRSRAPVAVVPVVVPRKPRRTRGAAIGLLVGTLVLAVIGSVLLGTVDPDFQQLEATCGQRQCRPSDWSSLKARADAGYAMFALAGAAAVADVALWIADQRQVRMSASGLRVTF